MTYNTAVFSIVHLSMQTITRTISAAAEAARSSSVLEAVFRVVAGDYSEDFVTVPEVTPSECDVISLTVAGGKGAHNAGRELSTKKRKQASQL